MVAIEQEHRTVVDDGVECGSGRAAPLEMAHGPPGADDPVTIGRCGIGGDSVEGCVGVVGIGQVARIAVNARRQRMDMGVGESRME